MTVRVGWPAAVTIDAVVLRGVVTVETIAVVVAVIVAAAIIIRIIAAVVRAVAIVVVIVIPRVAIVRRVVVPVHVWRKAMAKAPGKVIVIPVITAVVIIPVVKPRLGDVGVIIIYTTNATVETVDSCGVAVVVHIITVIGKFFAFGV